MIKIPNNITDILRKKMKSPEGTLGVKLSFEKSIYDKSEPGGVLFENVVGGHYFRIERTNDLKIRFYHSSPGTGTRLAIVDISKSIPSLQVMLFLTWSPKEIKIYIGPLSVQDGEIAFSHMQTTDKNYMITKDEQVIEVGCEGVEISGIRIKKGNDVVLDSSAIKSWEEALQAFDTLANIDSKGNYMLEVIKSNCATTALVTGIEVYCKRRLQELETEGIKLNYDTLKQETKLTKEKIFARTSNYFQSLETMKEIWKHLVNINVYNLNPVAWQLFKDKLFPHRHSVVHTSILQPEMPNLNNQEPAFVTNELISIKDSCKDFIEKLHKATLELRKS